MLSDTLLTNAMYCSDGKEDGSDVHTGRLTLCSRCVSSEAILCCISNKTKYGIGLACKKAGRVAP